REVMTPRPDIVAMPADATLEDLHAKVVETRLNKIPVYEKTLDDIFGVVYSQDLLQIADQDLQEVLRVYDAENIVERFLIHGYLIQPRLNNFCVQIFERCVRRHGHNVGPRRHDFA